LLALLSDNSSEFQVCAHDCPSAAPWTRPGGAQDRQTGALDGIVLGLLARDRWKVEGQQAIFRPSKLAAPWSLRCLGRGTMPQADLGERMLVFRQLFDPQSSTYTYLLGDKGGGKAVLIDPVFEQVRRDAALIGELGLGLVATLETHVHADHVTGAWLLKRRVGSIAVRGAADADIEIVETHHGPVIAGDPKAGTALTLRSVQFAETDLSFDCLPPMLHAATVDALYDSTRGWGLIDHNLVAADTTGKIGHLVRAIVPKRSRLNGWLPVPGWTGDHEWQGVVPFEAMPRTVDPPRGFLVTANNRVVGDDHPDYLCTDCHPPYRARRIEDRLAQLPAATVEDMRKIHSDDVSLTGLEFRAHVAALAPADAGARDLRDWIAGWDGRMEAHSVGAACYAACRWQLALLLAERSGLAAAACDPLLQVPPGVVPVNQLWWALPALLRTDDTRLLAGIGWNQALEEALLRTAAGFEPKPWGAIHRARMVHPLSSQFPEAAALLDPSGLAVGGDNDTVWATGCYAGTGLAAIYGAIARYVFDVGAWHKCAWVVFHGVSGQPGSPHYADQHAAWAALELVPMLYDWAVIAAESSHLVLMPHADS
jgi:penicillin amidase